jgi:integrase
VRTGFRARRAIARCALQPNSWPHDVPALSAYRIFASVLWRDPRHGLRAAEIAALRWDQVDLPGGTLHVTRVKQGTPTTHPLRGPELRALRRLQREQPEHGGYVFVTERGGPMAGRTVHHIVAEAGRAAQLAFPIHPHMLRHATGYSLARQGTDTRALQAYLGHRDIRHTVRYTDLAPARFKEFWKD